MKRKFKEWDDERHLEVLRENEQKKVCKKCRSREVCVYKKAFDGRCVSEIRSEEKEVEECEQ